MDSIYEPDWSNYLQQFDLPASQFQNIRKDTNKFCVIVEPRKHSLLGLVIKNFMYLLQNKGYGLIIFHGNNNKEFIEEQLIGWPNVIYSSLHVDNLTVNDYNNLLKSIEFWEKILNYGCKHSLIFQTDVVLLKDSVDDYLNYDYVGAPWNQTSCRWFGCLEVGNGGFSLRNTQIMIDIIKKHGNVNTFNNEDIYFSMLCLLHKYNVPTIDVAKTFSLETLFYHDPCGIHKPFLHEFPPNEYKRILSKRFFE